MPAPTSLNANTAPDVYAALSRWLDIGPTNPYRVEFCLHHSATTRAVIAGHYEGAQRAPVSLRGRL